MSKGSASAPEDAAPAGAERVNSASGRGLLGSPAVLIGGGIAAAALAFALGFGAVTLLRPAPAPVSAAAVEPPPPPPRPTELKLTEFIVRTTVGGRPVGLSAVLTILLPSQASLLILQSRMPDVREGIYGILAGHLVRENGEEAEDRLRAEILNALNAVIASISCSDLPAATRAEGCYSGQEQPATEIAIGRLIRF